MHHWLMSHRWTYCVIFAAQEPGRSTTLVGLEGARSIDWEHDGIERGGGADKQAVALRPAEYHVGHGLRDAHLAKEGPIRVIAMDAVVRTRPDASGTVQPEP